MVCWCTFVFPFASQSRQSEKHSFDLSAGKAGQAWKIPQSVWTNLNSFVFLIGFDVYQPGEVNVEYAKRFGQLKAYSELRAATQQWGNETFPLLDKLATELSKGEIKELLSAMSVALSRRKSDPRAAQKEFEEKFIQLNQRFNELGQLSATVTEQFDKFQKAGRAAIYEYQSRNFPENQWVKLGPKLDEVQTALGLMNGQWAALKSDLNDLQKLMANQKLDDVDIEVGLLTWDDITASAKGFVTNIPAQQKYLTGENYYDDCPIDVNSYYLIISKEREHDSNFGALITNGNALLVIPLKGSPNDERKEWRFTRFGKGWWRISNRAKDYSVYALGTTNMSSDRGYHRWWRVLPTQGKEWFRMINASTGELRSLTASFHSVTLSPTKNQASQYWRFVKTSAVR
jgi:hypothetical protein